MSAVSFHFEGSINTINFYFGVDRTSRSRANARRNYSPYARSSTPSRHSIKREDVEEDKLRLLRPDTSSTTRQDHAEAMPADVPADEGHSDGTSVHQHSPSLSDPDSTFLEPREDTPFPSDEGLCRAYQCSQMLYSQSPRAREYDDDDVQDDDQVAYILAANLDHLESSQEAHKDSGVPEHDSEGSDMDEMVTDCEDDNPNTTR
ncbi:hypothetical protein EIP86_000183 [Pleurotus ostreatoroseus]|nr:hypothetical protein EIP86_000183 [Pleurotus ostreatoroseus]